MAIQLKTQIPGPESQRLMQERKTHVARGPFHITPVFAARAHGAQVTDVDGNTLIDLTSGIGVTNVGHTPDALVHAIQAQASQILHTSFNVLPYPQYIDVAAALNRSTPGDFPKKTLLVNSGAEAVENAIKIARAFTKRQAVICFEHGYHGRTYMAMTLTSKAKPYRQDFGPFNSEVYRTPYPYAYRWPHTSDPDQVALECFQRFEELVTHQVGPTQTAAVIIEPVLGEGGFVPAPKKFLQLVRDYCQTHGIVLIADEIQTGFGRTGTLFACEQLGIAPDLITSAKGLAGGLPLAAVTGRAEIMDAPIEGGVGGTYGGNPVACASALQVFQLFQNGSLLARAQDLGKQLAKQLEQWKMNFPRIGDVRGLGPMRAMEFVKDRNTREPDRDSAQALIRHCYQNGVVIMSAGTYGNVIRFLVPLVIQDSELQEALKVVEAGLTKGP